MLESDHSLRRPRKAKRQHIGTDRWYQKLLSRLNERYFLVAVLVVLMVGWVAEMVYFGFRLNDNFQMAQNMRHLNDSMHEQTSSDTSLLEEYNLSAQRPPAVYILPRVRDLSPVAKIFGGESPQTNPNLLASGRPLIKPPFSFASILKQQSPFQVVSNIIQTPGTMPPLKLEDIEIKEPLEARKKEAVAALAGRISHDRTEVYLVSLKGQTYQMQAGEMVSGYRLVKDKDKLLLVKAGEMLRVE